MRLWEAIMEILRKIQSKLFFVTYYLSMGLGLVWLLTERPVQGISTILLAIIASELIKLRKGTILEDDQRWSTGYKPTHESAGDGVPVHSTRHDSRRLD
jgi:hypothetical protein